MVKKLLRRSWQAFDYEDVKSQRSKLLTSVESVLRSEAHALEASQTQAPLSVYASLLRRCGNAKALEPGRRVHAHVQRFLGDHPGEFLANLLLQMYAKCGSPENARRVFDSVQTKTVFTWNLMLTAYARTGHINHLLGLFHRMVSEDETLPNAVTYTTVVTACAMEENLSAGRGIHVQLLRRGGGGLLEDGVLATSLINMYGRCSSVVEARTVFDSLRSKCLVAWNTTLIMYVENDRPREALELFRGMIQQTELQPDSVSYTSAFRACGALRDISSGREIHKRLTSSGGASWWDVVLGNTLIKMYSLCGSVGEARRVFEAMARKNTVTWTTMSITYALSGYPHLSMELYSTMNLQGVKPHRTVFPSFIGASCTLQQGKSLHARVKAEGNLSDPAIGNALVAMYGRFGEVEQAEEVFDSMPERNVITWTSMIAANANNGHWEESLHVFSRMTETSNVRPNEVTYLTLIDSCSDFGTLAEGRAIHAEVQEAGYETEVAVSNALVNMYGKCGSLTEARAVFNSIREPSFVSWTSMLAAYAHQGHGGEALELQRRMEVEGVEMDYVTFVSVLSALGHAGLVEECRRWFVIMVGDHEIPARVEHYNCMVDSLGRAGWVEDARDLLHTMPFEAAYKEWINLLGSCKTHGEREVGGEAAAVARQLEPGVAQPYIMLLSITGCGEEEE